MLQSLTKTVAEAAEVANKFKQILQNILGTVQEPVVSRDRDKGKQ